MKNKSIETKTIKFEGGELLGVKTPEGKIYMGVRKAMRDIGLTDDQAKRQVKNIQEDMVLRNGIAKLNIEQAEGNRICKRKVLCLELKYLPIWVSSINRKTLNPTQFKNLINLLNWSLSSDFDNLKYEDKLYSFESLLIDEIYESKYVNNVKILEREKQCVNGRIDLFGVDKKGRDVIIECKRYVEYNDVIEQCIKYRQCFPNARIVILQYDCSDIVELAKKNDIECLEYKRELKINKVA